MLFIFNAWDQDFAFIELKCAYVFDVYPAAKQCFYVFGHLQRIISLKDLHAGNTPEKDMCAASCPISVRILAAQSGFTIDQHRLPEVRKPTFFPVFTHHDSTDCLLVMPKQYKPSIERDLCCVLQRCYSDATAASSALIIAGT
jgi:hypothetical protein